MSETITVVRLRQPGEIDDPLTEVLRAGARQLLAQAIEAEVAAFLGDLKTEKLADGRDRMVRHGHGPERLIQTGIGPVAVQRAKVRDRLDVPAAQKIRFSSALLPKWARRTRSLADDAASALLGAQDRERAEQGGAIGAALDEGGPFRDLALAEPGCRRDGDRRVRREVRRQVLKCGGVRDQGSRAAPGVLRFSRRALGPFADDQPD